MDFGGGYTISGLAADGYEAGATVTFTVTADEGKKIDSVKVGDETLTANASGQYSFEIGNADVTIVVSVSNETITPPEPVEVEITLNKTEVSLDQIGKTETLTAAVTGFEGVVSWTSTDATKISVTPSEDGLSCTVTNVGGGTAVITATAGSKNAIATVTGSIYTGDVRETYTVYNTDNTVKIADVKGFWNAISKLEASSGNGYITQKDKTDVLYTKDNHWLKGVGKYGPTDETEGLANFQNGDVPAWVAGYNTGCVDELKETNILVGNNGESNYGHFDQRATNWFVDETLPDGFHGYTGKVGSTGVITSNIWSGWRASEYLASVTSAEYVSWHQNTQWKDLNLIYDLSDSQLTPSYNEDQGVFAQIYMGSSTRIQQVCGMYFDAGTMEECLELEDGATRNIYTFSETLGMSGGLKTGMWGADRAIDEEHSIGTAVWDAFNKTWTFPDVKIHLNCITYYTDDADNADANHYYNRAYTITGLKDDVEVGKVNYNFNYNNTLTRDEKDAGGEAVGERTIYGVSFTPDYDAHEVADITCGAKWSNVLLDVATIDMVDETANQVNWQFMAGRSVNEGCQTALLGADCMSGEYTADGKSLFDFYY